MHYKAFLSFTLLGASAAQSLSSRSQYARLHELSSESRFGTLSPGDVATLVSIKSALKHGAEQVNVVNAAIRGITSSNAKTQLGTVNDALKKLSSDIVGDMKKLKASGTIGIGEILGLLQEAPRNELIKNIMDLVVAFNGTFTEMGNRVAVTKKDPSLVDIVSPGIKSLRQGLVDIVAIVPSQVPAIAKGPIDSIVAAIAAKSAAPPPAGGDAPAAIAPPPPAPAAPEGGAAPKGKGAGKGKGGAPKGGSSAKSGSGSGVTLNSLLASPEAQKNIGDALDVVLDQVIAYLKGTVNSIIPQEVIDQVFPTGAPEGFPAALVGPRKAPAAAAAPSGGDAPAPSGGDADASPAPSSAPAPAPKASAPKGAPKGKDGATPKGKGAPKAAPKASG